MQANPCFSLRNARIREQEAARLPQNISHILLLPWIFPKNSRKTLEWSAHKTNCSEGQMPSWEKGQCTGKTKTGYAPELPTGVCYVRIVQLQNLSGLRVLSDAKVRDPQSSNILTHRYTTFERLIIFQTILRNRLWTLAVPWRLADEAAVSHGRAAHSEVLVPDFPLTVDSHHRSLRFKKPNNPLLTGCLLSMCCCYTNKIQYFIIAALLKYPSAPRLQQLP